MPKAPKSPKSKRGMVIDIHAHQSDPVVGKFIREKSGRTGGGFAGSLKATKR